MNLVSTKPKAMLVDWEEQDDYLVLASSEMPAMAYCSFSAVKKERSWEQLRDPCYPRTSFSFNFWFLRLMAAGEGTLSLGRWFRWGNLKSMAGRRKRQWFHWEKNSVAIWDNRSTFHTGVPDFRPYNRRGFRVTFSGEIPYYDPNSGIQAQAWEATAKSIVAKQEVAKVKAEADGKASAQTA
ncbi:hypothetical protein BGZ65_000841 [Modicella reniformis]|uniref:TauD/TfdA-like domain-containing protein n=1 Tax=Modicella reniformis TaxID=1440133 RepID=A0A9P6IME1_9FUNG|nr:hypothetical protein BGZ65_000841 [Modicella reniformis]